MTEIKLEAGEKETVEFLTPDSIEDQVLALQFDLAELMRRVKELEKMVSYYKGFSGGKPTGKESLQVEPYGNTGQLKTGVVLTDRYGNQYVVTICTAGDLYQLKPLLK